MLKALLVIPREFFQDVLQALVSIEGVTEVHGFQVDGQGNIHVYVEYYDDTVNTAFLDHVIDSLVDEDWYSFWNLHSDRAIQ